MSIKEITMTKSQKNTATKKLEIAVDKLLDCITHVDSGLASTIQHIVDDINRVRTEVDQ
jgi:hypothetical protein